MACDTGVSAVMYCFLEYFMYPPERWEPRDMGMGLWFRAPARSKRWAAHSRLSVGTREMIHLSGAAVWNNKLGHEEARARLTDDQGNAAGLSPPHLLSRAPRSCLAIFTTSLSHIGIRTFCALRDNKGAGARIMHNNRS